MSAELLTVRSLPGTQVVIRGELNHRCPHVDEADYGTVVLRWTTTKVTLELHALRRWLALWSTVAISHEDLVQAVVDVVRRAGVVDVSAEATFTTAGLEVTVGAVPGNSLRSGGA